MAENKEEQKVETTGAKKVEDKALETKTEEGVLSKIVARNEGQSQTTQNEETKPDIPVVTEEMVKEFPALKTLVGKPITEVMKSHAALNTRLSQSENELSTLRTKTPEKKEEKKPDAVQSTKTVDEQIEELIDKAEIPDALDDPVGNKKALLKLSAKISKLQNEAGIKPLSGLVESERQREEAVRQMSVAQEILKSKLPEDADIAAIRDGFAEFIAPIVAENPTMYHGRPELLASDIAVWFYSEENKRLKSGGKETLRKVVKDLKNRIEDNPEKPGESVKASSEDDGLSPTMKAIIERNKDRMPKPGVR